MAAFVLVVNSFYPSPCGPSFFWENRINNPTLCIVLAFFSHICVLELVDFPHRRRRRRHHHLPRHCRFELAWIQ